MLSNDDLLKFTLSLAKEAGQIQMNFFGRINNTEKKSTAIDLLTEADKQSENYIVEKIQNKFSDNSILSE